MNRSSFILLLFITLLLACNSNKEKSDSSPNDNIAAKNSISKSQGKTAIDLSKIDSETLQLKSPDSSDMIFFKGGQIVIGSSKGSTRHQPPFETAIEPFYMDKYPVTVKKFAEFVEATGFETEAEKFGDSGVFDFTLGNWDLVKGASWRFPLGPDKPKADPSHPVTHVSWNDAVAYAVWAGKRLPTEFEWEYAAKNGKSTTFDFPWGDKETHNGSYMANTWQGEFAIPPAVEDGYLYTSPVGSFAPTEAGLYDIIGNVWEWCSNTFKPYAGSGFTFAVDEKIKAMRGGSFMYDHLGTESFKVYGRSYNTAETSLFNTGFRCVLSAK
jgi:sulfatase modifying factor 1